MNVQLNSRQKLVAQMLMGNSALRTGLDPISSFFSGGAYSKSDTFKHDLYYDFGYPRSESLTFEYYYEMFQRNGLATALVERTSNKTWQDTPSLRETEDPETETDTEKTIRRGLDDLRFWQVLRETDKRSMVGKYAGVVFQLRDGKPYSEPVTDLPNGLNAIVSMIPAWERQLEPSSWNTDPGSPDYGKPTMFRFNESNTDPEYGKFRAFTVHPDRCFIWSEDGTTWGESKLKPCYNALMDAEKIRGAGGEGFWKNAKAQPVLQANENVDFSQLARMLDTDSSGLADALDEVVGKWAKGFDESLLLQNIEAKTLSVALPEPEEFFDSCIKEIAASWPIPQKVLVGMQTGERASTEDAREWAQTNKSRRINMVTPNIMSLVQRFRTWGVLPDLDWCLTWADLTAPTLADRLDIAEKMARSNQMSGDVTGPVFTVSDMRKVVGLGPLESSLTDGIDKQ